ncbi:phosphotransferase enzyme family protein [Thermochromatium tepidum]|uniref:Phosphotransferase n=1 Tax=Thermochromatium tepidum ATCC 43061 TaxID=316276 RepID=A0A6I6E368_THETI|nr:aminoglycoside phosphotransferase family protein [Thermochromatium tepidum]QGU32172.1 phosphotransferase [Thermochromatium tepidum ATCC 43061]
MSADVRSLIALCEQFAIERPVEAVAPLGRGLINETYRVETGGGCSVLQRLNDRVFPAPERILTNLARLAEHPEPPESFGLRVPALIPSRTGAPFVRDASGAVWRLMEFIPDTCTLPRLQETSQAREVGRILGRFHRWISALPSADFAVTLPGYHDTSGHLKRLMALSDARRAAPEMGPIFDFIEARLDLAEALDRAVQSGRIVPRLTHGDPKLDNILFDRDGRRALALIDLDTLQPGLIQHDLGDCLRSCCNVLGEAETDPAKVRFDLVLAAAILTGYAEVTRGWLSDGDIDSLFDGIRVMPFELGLRFLTDHLQGDRYFKVDRPGRNLIKAQIQFALVADIERREPEIRAAIQAVFG